MKDDHVYGNVMFCSTYGSTCDVEEYFRDRAKVYMAFSYLAPYTDGRMSFRRYESGTLVASREYRGYPGQSPFLRKVFFSVTFLYVALFLAPDRTWLVNNNPPFCVGSGFLRVVRGHRMVLWPWDRFDDRSGLYPLYNAIVAWYRRSLTYVLFISKPMAESYGEWPDSRTFRRLRAVVPLGIRDIPSRRIPEDGLLGFIGTVEHGKGLEAVFAAMKLDPSLRLEVVGNGTALEEYRAMVVRDGVGDRVAFLGRIDDEEGLERACRRWQIGVAPYEKTSYSPYADPGKIKTYWKYRLPVLTTREASNSEEIIREKAGVVAASGVEGIVASIREMRAAGGAFDAGVERMRQRYEYRRIYDAGFEFMRSHP